MTPRPARTLLGLLPLVLAAAAPPPAHNPPHGQPSHPAPHHAAPPASPATPPPAPPPTLPDIDDPDHGEPDTLAAIAAGSPALRRCLALVSWLTPRAASPGQPGIEADDAGGCLFRNIRLAAGGVLAYRMDLLRVQGVPTSLPEDRLPPLTVHVEGRGLTQTFRGATPAILWATRMIQRPFDMTVTTTYDLAARTLTLSELSLDGPTLGHTELRGVLEDAYVTQPNLLRSDLHGDPGLRSFHAGLASRTFLLTYAVNAVAGLLPPGDPDEAFRAGQAQVIGAVRGYLAMTSASPATVDAVAAFLGDFPRPQHPFALDVSASAPVHLQQAADAADDPAKAAALLRTLTVTATYEGALPPLSEP